MRNSLGLRDRELRPRVAGVTRLLALGDFLTYGWGVAVQDWGGVVKAGRDRRRTAHQSVRQSNSIRGPIGYPGSLGPRELPRILDGHAAGRDAEQRRNERGEQLKSKNGRRAFARVISLALPVALAVGWTIPVCAEPSVGLTGGLTLSGDQDVTLVNRGEGVESRDVSAAVGPVGGMTGTLWLGHFGLQLDGLYWRTSAPARLPGSLKTLQVSQDRGAMLTSLMGRVFLDESGRTFAYGGVGGGPVVIGVNPGQTAVVAGVGALVGVAFPVTSHVRVRAEVRYLLTHDMDPKAGRGISTEVSGSRGSNPGRALFGPHFDSEFVPLLIGLDYVF